MDSVEVKAIPLPRPAQRRREALGPWADAVASALAAVEVPRLPDSICAQGRGVDLGSWEKSVLRSTNSDAFPDEREALVVDGLAYQAKCREIIERLDRFPLPGPDERPALIDELVTDAAVGFALRQELQRQIEGLVQVGRTAEAKSVTQFRNRIVRTSSRLGEIVEGDLARRAEEMAETMIVEASLKPQRAEAPAGPVQPDVATPAAQRPRPAGTASADSRPAGAEQPRLPLRIMIPVLAVLTGVSLWLNARSLIGEPGLPVLGLEHFAAVDGVQAVVARPPSLYVTVDETTWDALPPNGRRRVLEDVARVVEGSGYVGLHVRTDKGRTVGQWSSEAGLKLVQQAAGPS